MELAVLLILFAAFLISFKVLGLIFKAGFFLLALPFQILGAVLGVVLLVLILPFAAVVAVLSALLAPLFVLGPVIPLLLVGAGIYLLAKD